MLTVPGPYDKVGVSIECLVDNGFMGTKEAVHLRAPGGAKAAAHIRAIQGQLFRFV